MKKILLTLGIFILGINNTVAYSCDDYSKQMIEIKSEMSDIEYKRTTIESDLRKTYRSVTTYMFNAMVVNKDKELVAEYNLKVLDYNSKLKLYKGCLSEIDEYVEKASGYYSKGDYNKAIDYYNKLIKLGYEDEFLIYYNMGLAYYNMGNIDKAVNYYNKAYKKTFDSTRIDKVKNAIKITETAKELEKEKDRIKEAIKNAPSNDSYSYLQYYLNKLNITKAQKSFTKNKQVIIAVIDDGININHPDLSENIWLNKKEIAGNGIDDDDNGYIDDYNGWNFASDNYVNILPAGSHGTSVAGLIGAKGNNSEGIMGIAKNVKIMNLRAFELSGGAYQDNIINAINYAIDNGANIINLSLTSNHLLKYTNKYDEVIKKAEKKGVIMVIASGNGDTLSNQTEGVNTSINKLSPICNDSNVNNVIGVGATNKDGLRTRWSNYGNCVDFYAPGTDIFTLSVLSGNTEYGDKYDIVDGTSFSAPIISGIIGLGYNKYGKINPITIYNTLNKSIIKEKNGAYHIDAYIYLNELGKYFEKVKNDKYQETLKKQLDKIFNKIKRKYNRYSEEKRTQIYTGLLQKISEKKEKIKDKNKLFIFEYFLELIAKEIPNTEVGCDEVGQLLGICE